MYLVTNLHPIVISQKYMFYILKIDTGSFSIFFKGHLDINMFVVFLLYSNVDVTGITQLESSSVPDLEKSVQGCNLQSTNSSFNTVMGNPYSLVDSGLTLEASTPLQQLLEQPSSDEEISFDPEEDLDFSVRYPLYKFYIVHS